MLFQTLKFAVYAGFDCKNAESIQLWFTNSNLIFPILKYQSEIKISMKNLFCKNLNWQKLEFSLKKLGIVTLKTSREQGSFFI